MHLPQRFPPVRSLRPVLGGGLLWTASSSLFASLGRSLCWLGVYLLAGIPWLSGQDYFQLTTGSTGFDVATWSAQTPSGDFLVAGTARLAFSVVARLDPSGELRWVRQYGPTVFTTGWATVDDGAVLAGRRYDEARVIRLDADGNVVWDATLGLPGSQEQIEALVPAPDGGWVLTGLTTRGPGGGGDVLLLRLNPDGSLRWSRAYGGPADEEARDVTLTPEGDILLAGTTLAFHPDSTDALLMRVDDNSGDLVWARGYPLTGDQTLNALDFTQSGAILATGTTRQPRSTHSDVYFLRVDPDNGSMLLSQAYGNRYIEVIRDMVPVPGRPDVYALAGTIDYGEGFVDAYVMNLSEYGFYEQVARFGGIFSREELWSIGTTAEGGFLLTGMATPLDNPNAPVEWYMVHSDVDFQLRSCLGQVAAGDEIQFLDMPWTLTRDPGFRTEDPSLNTSPQNLTPNTLDWVLEVVTPPRLEFSVTHTDESCPNARDGRIEMEATTTPPVGVNFYLNGIQRPAVLTDLPPDTYEVWAIDELHGCEAREEVVIRSAVPLQAQLDLEPATCFLASDGQAEVQIRGGRPPYRFFQLPEPPNTQPLPFDPPLDSLAPGPRELMVVDSFGCSWDTSFVLGVKPEMDISTDTIVIYLGEPSEAPFSLAPGSVAGGTFRGEGVVDGTQGLFDPGPIEADRLFSLTYAVGPCEVEKQVWVDVRDLRFAVPSVFTPNGDGINDRLEVRVGDRELVSFQVFHAQGGRVFSADQQPIFWDGSDGGGRVRPGTYFYRLQYRTLDGQLRTRTGHITVLY